MPSDKIDRNAPGAVFVGNISYDTTEQDLHNLMSEVGPVKAARVTLHFLPLKRGVIEMDAFKVVDSITGKCFRLRKPFVISVVGGELDVEISNGA